MGWSSYGYVFTRRPSWDRLGDLPLRGCGVVGYKHRSSDVWLGGFADRRDRGAAAFAFHPEVEWTVDRRGLDPATHRLLTRVDSIAAALDTQYVRFAAEYLIRALAVADRAEVPTYFFTADDEFQDVGCRAEPGRVTEFAGRFPDFSVRCWDGGVRVLVPDREALSSFPAERLDALRGVEGVEVAVRRGQRPPPLPVAAGGGSAGRRRSVSVAGDLARWGVFYRFPVELWPPEAGDPAAVLGLGTWDLFDGFDQDFEPEFPRAPAESKSRRTRRCT
jgi:hypothetical protein